jgi:hypothetical protein
MRNFTEKYKHFNHHHEITENDELVNIGGEEFIANKKAIPLLKALNDLGLKTRTHHIDNDGGFFSIILDWDKDIEVELRNINERDSSRTIYNGKKEILISWINKLKK